MIKPLISLRFLFAVLVFSHHLGFVIGPDNKFRDLYCKLFADAGPVGVCFFFILSGFILTHVYQEKIIQKKIKIKNFYLLRFLRIYPLYFLTLLLAIPLKLGLLLTDHKTWLLIFSEHLTMTQSFVPIRDHYFSFNLVSWCISNEFFFYLAFPFIILLFSKINFIKKLVLFVFISIGISILIYVLPSRLDHAIIYINPGIRIFDFILGIVLYDVYKKLHPLSKSKATYFELASIVFLVIMYIVGIFLPQVIRYSIYYWLPVSFLILVFAMQNGKISFLLSNKLLMILGGMSYGLYISHFLIIKYVTWLNKRFEVIDSVMLLIIFVFLLSLICGYFAYSYIENPINKLLRKRKSA
ncbi:MAG: acyltransferase [Bacteroidales bacterium]|nr:acyltransferase [Bacteroidales bacterium]